MISTRAAVVTAVTLVPLAVFGGVGFAKGNPSASEYQYGPSGGQYGKVAVCHKTGSRKHPWHRINVALPAWNHGHSHHGDFQIDSTHPCPPVTAPTSPAPVTHGKSGEHGHGHGNGNGNRDDNDDNGNNGNDGNDGSNGNNGHHGKH